MYSPASQILYRPTKSKKDIKTPHFRFIDILLVCSIAVLKELGK
jgi:hypothetical protein